MHFDTLLILVFLLQPGVEAGEGFLIVASVRSPTQALTQFQLRNLYLGKLESINKHRTYPVTVSDRLKEYKAFNQWLLGPGFDWNAYWTDQAVKGAGSKPFSLGSFALVLAFLERNHEYIGYVPASYKDELKNFKVKTIEIKQ